MLLPYMLALLVGISHYEVNVLSSKILAYVSIDGLSHHFFVHILYFWALKLSVVLYQKT